MDIEEIYDQNNLKHKRIRFWQDFILWALILMTIIIVILLIIVMVYCLTLFM